jgi:cysteine desulfurase
MSKRTIYADNNATTAVAPEVVEAMLPFLKEEYFNPSSMYERARTTHKALEEARKTVATALGARDPSQILFTSCATEANNTAILGAIRANPGRRHLITSSVEHPSVYELCKDLERQGYEITYVPVDQQGRIDVRAFVRSLRPDTLMVSLMHANNETGVIFPIEQLARLTKETDPAILFHTDATQSVGKLDIQMDGRFKNVDLLSFSGHKLHGPKGVGALFIRKGSRIRPFMLGGHQENGRRAGTENVPFIVALAKACELATENREEEVTRVQALRDRLEKALVETIPYVQVNGDGAARLPNTLNISIHYIEGEGMLYQLDAFGICASSGSACTSGSLEPSHVLRAMKVPFTAVHGSVRFSLSRYNTDEDVDTIVRVFPDIVESLRRLSPYWDITHKAPRPDAPTG